MVMVDRHKKTGNLVVLSSFILSFMLMMLPLPAWVDYARPEFLPLVFFYWCLAMPDRIGIFTAWFVGIVLDLLYGTLLGQNSLGLILVAFILNRNYQRIRLAFSLRQSMLMGAYIICYKSIVLLVNSMIGIPLPDWKYLFSILTSILIWPWLFMLLRNLRRKYVSCPDTI